MTLIQNDVTWIAVDWGTSSLRIWVVGIDGGVLQAIDADRGMSTLVSTQYEEVLLDLCEQWLPCGTSTPVIICGMAGSREGWQQAPDLHAPLTLLTQEQPIFVQTQDPRLRVYITPGLMQADPAEVMRGEETQIIGLLSHYPDFDGTALLPGTHSKWVTVAANRIETFSTYMTGELFALLCEHSILRQALNTSDWSQCDFDKGFIQAFEHPADLTNNLFNLRTESLLNHAQPQKLKAHLSGGLIGLELASMTANNLAGLKSKDIAIIGTTTIADLYQHALKLIGLNSTVLPDDAMTLAGLNVIRQTITTTIN